MGICKNQGIGLVTGEPGCGKTTALRKYVSGLNPAYFKVCYFALSTVTVLEFYKGLAMELGENPPIKRLVSLSKSKGNHQFVL